MDAKNGYPLKITVTTVTVTNKPATKPSIFFLYKDLQL